MRRSNWLAVCVGIIALFSAGEVRAQTGTWNVTSGSWDNTANWLNSVEAQGADQSAYFNAVSAPTITDDLSTLTIGYMYFGNTASVLNTSATTNVLTLQTTVAGATPGISVLGNTTTISTSLAGTQGFIKSGSGTLVLNTNADTFTGNAVINAGTFTVNIGQASTAGIVLANGTTLAGNQALSATNFVQIVSGTAAVSIQGGSNTVSELFSGNGTINWTEGTVSNVTFNSSTANIFGNFGGTVAWGTNGSGLRVTAGNDDDDVLMPFATIDLGTSTGAFDAKQGFNVLTLGAVAGSGTSSTLGGGSTYDYGITIGSANTTTTFNGSIANGGGNEVAKVGLGSMTITGSCTETGGYYYGQSVNAYGGTLAVSYARYSSSVLYSGDTLGIGQGGTLLILGNSGALVNTIQTVASVTAGTAGSASANVGTTYGGGSIVVNPNGGAGTTLNMNRLAVTGPGSSLNLTAMPGSVAITTTSAVGADGTYGGRLTYTDSTGNTDFATAVTSVGSTSTLGRYTGYSAFTGSTDVGTTDYSLTGNGALSLSETVNLLKISTNGNGQSLGGAYTLSLSGGGLLFTGSNNYSINASTLNSFLFTSGGNANADIVIQNYGTGSLTINAKMNNNNGNATLSLDGPGTTVVTNTANSYNGVTYVDGATLSTSSALVLGGTGNTAALDLFGGTFQATQPFSLNNGTTNHNVTIGGGGGTFDVTAGNTLTVAGVVSNLFSGAGRGNALYAGPLVKTDAGTLVLSGANTYYGATIIDGGVLSVSTLANGNSTSGIGESPSAAPALVLNGGTLQYTGAGASTDRSFVLTPNGGGIDASGTGPLLFSTTSSAMLVPAPIVTTGPLAGSGARNLTLTGTNTGQNIFAGQILDGTGGSTSVTKAGSGYWMLSNANNTYSGATTISSGTLALAAATSNPIPNSSIITIASGGTLDVTGLNNSSLQLSSGQALSGAGLFNGSLASASASVIVPGTVSAGSAGIGTLNVNGGVTLANGTIVNFGLDSTSGTSSLLNVGGTLALPGSGTAITINLYSPNSASTFTPPNGISTYDLFQYSSITGGSNSVVSDLSVGVNNAAFNYSFGTANVGGIDYVQLTAVQQHITANWNTNGSSNWSGSSNWTGNVPPHSPGDAADFGTVITSPATVTLDEPVSLGQLIFGNTNSYTISGTNTLTMSTTGASSITDSFGVHTIAVPVSLAIVTLATVTNPTDVLTISGNISGSGLLTVSGGNGTLILSGSNTYGPAPDRSPRI